MATAIVHNTMTVRTDDLVTASLVAEVGCKNLPHIKI